MNWQTMSWTDKFNAVADVFGTTDSDCGADELLHLWDEIRKRGLENVYIAFLASLLGIPPSGAYSPAQLMQMMTASDEQYHWPAALRASGQGVIV